MPSLTAIDMTILQVIWSMHLRIKVKNLASLPESEMPEFLRRIKAYPADAQTHHAIILIMLTGVRVSELLQARWDEFDLEECKWDIPAERMKNGLPHRVP